MPYVGRWNIVHVALVYTKLDMYEVRRTIVPSIYSSAQSLLREPYYTYLVHNSVVLNHLIRHKTIISPGALRYPSDALI